MVDIRIGITGTHGAGKTTLARALAKALNLPLVSERARAVAARMGVSSSHELLTDRRLAHKFQVSVLSEQIEAEAQHSSFISDRTALDCLAYWHLYGLNRGAISAAYSRRCLIRPYSMVIYIAPESIPDQDGFRLTGEANQTKVDEIIQDLLTQYSASPIAKITGTPKDRLFQALALIGGLTAEYERPEEYIDLRSTLTSRVAAEYGLSCKN